MLELSLHSFGVFEGFWRITRTKYKGTFMSQVSWPGGVLQGKSPPFQANVASQCDVHVHCYTFRFFWLGSEFQACKGPSTIFKYPTDQHACNTSANGAHCTQFKDFRLIMTITLANYYSGIIDISNVLYNYKGASTTGLRRPKRWRYLSPHMKRHFLSTVVLVARHKLNEAKTGGYQSHHDHDSERAGTGFESISPRSTSFVLVEKSTVCVMYSCIQSLRHWSFATVLPRYSHPRSHRIPVLFSRLKGKILPLLCQKTKRPNDSPW